MDRIKFKMGYNMNQSIGKILTRLREEKKMTQRSISRKTNFPLKKIESLENDQFQHFPGKFYYISYIKEYLKTLGYDRESFLREHEALIRSIKFKQPDNRVQFSRIHYQRFKRKKVLLIFLVIIGLLALAGLVFFLLAKGKIDWENILGSLNHLVNP